MLCNKWIAFFPTVQQVPCGHDGNQVVTYAHWVGLATGYSSSGYCL